MAAREGRGEVVARRLVERQFPRLADRSLTRLQTDATDNEVFRLGADLVVRLPRNADSAARLAKELTWLPVVDRQVGVRVPTVVGVGRPVADFGFPWAVQEWIEGRDATSTAPGDWPRAAVSLAGFVRELREIDPTAGPTPDASNAFRGVALADLDERVRWGAAFARNPGSRSTAGLDVDRVLDVWETALAAPPWAGPPTWVHGDLLPGNVLLADGELTAVLDFGCAGVGDPACDGLATWTLFRGRARELFRAAIFLDDAADARARGWAVYVGITAAPYHHQTNPAFCAFARTVLDELLAAR